MLKKMRQKLKNERGLTLVELLAVVVILAIIAIIAFVFIGGIIDNSKKDAHISNAQQIISAAKLHEATGGDFPITATDLQEGDYLDKVLDPWNKKEYESLSNTEITKEEDAGEGEDKTEGGYKISGFKPNDGEGCTINASETELSTEDRDDLCE